MKNLALAVLLASACGHKPDAITPSGKTELPTATEATLDPSLKVGRRMLPPEAFLRAYLTWFGGLAPIDVVKKTQRSGLFDQWQMYLQAIGLPDYQLDMPRVTESNTIMLATFGRLAEALCVKSAQHDLHGRKHEPRVLFDFEPMAAASLDEFRPRFDVLHRTFLGYPADLAPPGRVERFFKLYQTVVARHEVNPDLTADELGWVAVCTALVQHPEAGLY